MGRRPIANGVTLRICTRHEGRHHAIVLSRRRPTATPPSLRRIDGCCVLTSGIWRQHRQPSAQCSRASSSTCSARRQASSSQHQWSCACAQVSLVVMHPQKIFAMGCRQHACVHVLNEPVRHPQFARHSVWLAARSVMIVRTTAIACMLIIAVHGSLL